MPTKTRVKKLRKPKQIGLLKIPSQHALAHGGELRKKRWGRGQRPLSTKHSLHLVFKLNQQNLLRRSLRNPSNFKLVKELFKKYSARFFVRIDQMSIQHNHIHVILRASRRQNFQSFFRVISGQIAQRLKVVTDTREIVSIEKIGDAADTIRSAAGDHRLWLERPFTRVVKAWKSLLTLRKYVALNEMEVTGRMKYRADRLRGLTSNESDILQEFASLNCGVASVTSYETNQGTTKSESSKEQT